MSRDTPPDLQCEKRARVVRMAQCYFRQQMSLGFDLVYTSPRVKCSISSHEERIKELYHQIKDCQSCSLHQTRNHFVFGEGNPRASVVFIGEAPGRDEDLQGRPFVGAAGQLLTKMLAAIDFNREQVFIGNILKCRPPQNRDPLPDEIRLCEPHLNAQLMIIQPKLICALGRIAAQALLKTTAPLSKLRGKVHGYQGMELIATYHPAALLRNPGFKRGAWEDLKLLRQEYNRLSE